MQLHAWAIIFDAFNNCQKLKKHCEYHLSRKRNHLQGKVFFFVILHQFCGTEWKIWPRTRGNNNILDSSVLNQTKLQSFSNEILLTYFFTPDTRKPMPSKPFWTNCWNYFDDIIDWIHTSHISKLPNRWRRRGLLLLLQKKICKETKW